jgi:hypothetical protein
MKSHYLYWVSRSLRRNWMFSQSKVRRPELRRLHAKDLRSKQLRVFLIVSWTQGRGRDAHTMPWGIFDHA